MVPTLGERPELLRQALASIRQQPISVAISVVAPGSALVAEQTAHEFGAQFIADSGSQVQAINLGVGSCLAYSGIEFVGWLNDDDLLEPNSMPSVIEALDSDPQVVAAFGACRYIDQQGRELFISRAGKWAPRILPWGPDLIPQPGMLVRGSAWRAVGGLDPQYRLAFDLDLLLRLKKIGQLRYACSIVSSFRWHPDSLTVEDRDQNLRESERAKRAALPDALRPLARLWEPPLRGAIRLAAKRVNKQAG